MKLIQMTRLSKAFSSGITNSTQKPTTSVGSSLRRSITREMNQLLDSLCSELEFRRQRGESHPQEQMAGEINDPEWREYNSGWSAYSPLE